MVVLLTLFLFTEHVFAAAPVPTAVVSVSPTTIVSGGSALLTWSSTNADSCVGFGSNPTDRALSGSLTVSPTATRTYYSSCTRNAGSFTPATWLLLELNDVLDLACPVTTIPANLQTCPVANPAGMSCNPQTQLLCASSEIHGCNIWTDRYICNGTFSATSTVTSNVVTVTVVAPLSTTCSVSPATANTGQSVTWTAVPSGGTGSYTYSWSGTDSLSGSAISVAKTYSTTGTKTGAVTVTSGTQTVSNIPCSNPVVVSNPPLSATCSVSPTTANTGQSFTLTASPSGGTGSYTYSWSGTDSLSGSAISVAKTYSTTGTKTGAVLVTSGASSVNPSCSNSVTVSLPPPTSGAPNAPTITGVSSGLINTLYSFTFQASDTDTPTPDQIRYEIDWDNSGSAESFLPSASTWTNSGTPLLGSYSWSTSGSKTLKARTRDVDSLFSGWTSKVVTISQPQCGDGIDNDGDGFTDTADIDCTSGSDTTEGGTVGQQCADLLDNDNDKLIDGGDYDCTSSVDNDESGTYNRGAGYACGINGCERNLGESLFKCRKDCPLKIFEF